MSTSLVYCIAVYEVMLTEGRLRYLRWHRTCMAVLRVGIANVAVTTVHSAGLITSLASASEYKRIALWHCMVRLTLKVVFLNSFWRRN